jgi:hypothetical protein
MLDIRGIWSTRARRWLSLGASLPPGLDSWRPAARCRQFGYAEQVIGEVTPIDTGSLRSECGAIINHI